MRFLCLATVLLFALPLAAQTDPAWFPNDYEGWYVGGGVAFTNVLASDNDGTASWERGDTDYGFIVNTGYRFNPYFALELGYLDGGKPEFDDNDFANRVDTDIDLSAVQFSGIGTLPFGERWELYLKLGLSAWDADSDQVLTPVGGPPVFRQESGSGPSLLAGIGLGVSFTENFYARLEYQTFGIDDELLALDAIATAEDDASFDSVNLEFHYRLGERRENKPIELPDDRRR